MKLSDYTLDYLGTFIAGDLDGLPYRGGPHLVRFFNAFGGRDVYPRGGGFPTRRIYAQDKLRELNGKPVMRDVIAAALDPRVFHDNDKSLDHAIALLNGQLKHDGYEAARDGNTVRVRELSAVSVRLESSAVVGDSATQHTIDANIRKCETKLAEGDFSGAITNARSLVEAVLIGIEKEFDQSAPDYDGDLIRLYRRVQRLLRLEPDRPDITEPLRQVMSGLTSVVTGLAGVRNKMGDAHGATFEPSRRHAKLAVYAATALADFLFETRNFEQRASKGGDK